jgi:endonuclease V-like protein UPF0215 family
MHIAKKGLRVLGIAESFSSRKNSILAGVVMRKDLRIDGFSFTTTTVGGMDATDSVITLYQSFSRQDINLIMIGGGIISWYNIIDPVRIFQETGRGTVIVTYEESEGLEDDIRHHFPGDIKRIAAYRSLGSRTPLSLSTGHTLYLRSQGISEKEAGIICSDFTYDGKVPEPLRVARLYARSVMRSDILPEYE